SYLEEPLIVKGSSLILRQFDNLTVNLSMNKYENQLYQSLLMGDYPEEGELIQLITDDDDDEQVQPDKYPEIIPILSVRNTVLFPGVVIPITVGRQRSIKLVKKAQKGDKLIGV